MVNQLTDHFKKGIFKPKDSLNVLLFTRWFGAVMILQVVSFYSADFLNNFILAPKFLFPYDFFGFVKPMPEVMMKFVFILLLLSAVLITINRFCKPALFLFLICFSYIFLLDKSYFNNHFYLIILLLILLFFSQQANEKNASKTKGTSRSKSEIPYGMLLALQLQVCIVYFYGGIAKLNADWLFRLEPMRTQLENISEPHAFLAPFLVSEAAVVFFSYGGLLFDLCIPFLLMSRKTLKAAVILTTLFHLINILLFNTSEKSSDIGIFPLLMIGSNLLFVPSEYLKQLLSKFKLQASSAKEKGAKSTAGIQLSAKRKKLILFGFMSFFIIQFLLPVRHFLIKGNVDWTGEGYYFSWRMKIRAKQGGIKIYVRENANSPAQRVDPSGFINFMQYVSICENPVMLWQFVQKLKTEIEKRGIINPVITVTQTTSMNGRTEQLVVDSTLNLAAVSRSPFRHAEWILPLR